MTEPTSRDTTTTTTARYRAQTDPSTKTWHLGTEAKGNVCVCGCKLITPDDTRPWALKVPADARHYETDPDVAKVTCGSCKRNREYAKATAAPLAEAAAERGKSKIPAELPPTPVEQAARPSRRRASTRTATPAEAGAGLNESTAAQLLVDGVQARARRRAKTGDPRADRAAADAVIEADPAEYAERVAAAQIAAARAARDAG